jgi:SPOR domain
MSLAMVVSAAVLGVAGCGSSSDGASQPEGPSQTGRSAVGRAGGPHPSAPVPTTTTENTTTVVTSTTTTVTGSTSSPPPTTGADDWPGGSGYTAILTSETSQAAAEATQARAASAGLDAGVLNSSDYSSLRPGYWVVFSGTFDTSQEAAARAQRAQGLGFGSAYPRFVSP